MAKRTNADGTTISGNFKDGQLDGPAKLVFANGDIITADYQNGFPIRGTLKTKDYTAEGPFNKDGQFDGQVKETYDSGTFVVNYVKGLREGHGVFSGTDGSFRWEADFKDGDAVGPGSMQLLNHQIPKLSSYLSFGPANSYGLDTRHRLQREAFNARSSPAKAGDTQYFVVFTAKPVDLLNGSLGHAFIVWFSVDPQGVASMPQGFGAYSRDDELFNGTVAVKDDEATFFDLPNNTYLGSAHETEF